MDNKGTQTVLVRSDILLNNEDYFKYIFKKTEKIIGAVFYTTRSLSDSSEKDTLVELVEDRAMYVSSVSLETLTSPRHTRTRSLEEFQSGLVALESGLSLLVVSNLMREDLFEVFRHEIGLLNRSLRDYLHEYPRHPFEREEGSEMRMNERTHRTRAPKAVHEQGEAGAVPAGVIGVGRRDRILGIIKDKGQVTIKDVSTAITDVSEKTIQRELMSLVSDGRIVKEGERRWSRYSIVSQ